MIILTARYICNRQMRRLRFPWTCIPSRRVAGYFFWRALTSPCRVRLGMATLRLRFERKLIESNAGRRPNGRLCELRSNTHACVRKRNTPPPGGVFLLACLTRFERAAFRVGADQTGYSKMQINKGIRRFLGFFPSIVFVTYIPKPSSIVHSSHRCVVEMW